MTDNKHRGLVSIQNIVLFIIVIVLPLFVAYMALNSMIDVQYQAECENVTNGLREQSSKIRSMITPEYQAKDFLSVLLKTGILKQKPKQIKKILKRIDNIYPNVFRWFFWDSNGKFINIGKQFQLQGSRTWQILVYEFMRQLMFSALHSNLTSSKSLGKRVSTALGIIQKGFNNSVKVEHLLSAHINPLEAKWLGKPSLMLWGVNALSYVKDNTPKAISGGVLITIFTETLEKLDENFWVKRLIVRYKENKRILKYPMLAINISSKKLIVCEANLQKKVPVPKVLSNYISRKSDVFEAGHYLAKAVSPDNDSEIRIFSIADIHGIQSQKAKYKTFLKFSIFLLLIISLFAIYQFIIKEAEYSLSTRIGILFLIAILLPVTSLISIGKMFASREKSRLIAEAYQKMRNRVNAINLRYKDFPRLTERRLFKSLQQNIRSAKSIEEIKQSLMKSCSSGLIRNFVLSNEDGSIHSTNWNQSKYPLIVKGIKLSLRNIVARDNRMNLGAANLARNYADKELEDLLSISGSNMDLTRPSHLRYFCLGNRHLYLMGLTVRVDDALRGIVVSLPETILENRFVLKEVAANRRKENFLNDSELSFYSSYGNFPHIPSESDAYQLLEKSFKRVGSMQVEETGTVVINNENFLYLISPLSASNYPFYIPCLLTTTKHIDAHLYQLQLLVIVLVLLASLATFVIRQIFASSLLRPIKQIDGAVKLLGEGNLEVKLPNMGNDELGRLSNTFNNMVKGLRERERMQAYVSDSVREAIQDSESSSWQTGKKVETTILFSDIRNFTGLSEKYKPEEIFSLLNDFLGGVEAIIRRNNGRVDKFIGDAVMAIFGENTSEPHAISAVKAAVEMKQYLKEMNGKRKKNKQFTIDIGIGLSTGEVMLGDIGSESRKDLTVIGDEVNLAARLEAASKKGCHSKIMMSGPTYEIVKDIVEAEQKDFSEIRGKKQAVSIFELIRLI